MSGQTHVLLGPHDATSKEEGTHEGGTTQHRYYLPFRGNVGVILSHKIGLPRKKNPSLLQTLLDAAVTSVLILYSFSCFLERYDENRMKKISHTDHLRIVSSRSSIFPPIEMVGSPAVPAVRIEERHPYTSPFIFRPPKKIISIGQRFRKRRNPPPPPLPSDDL